MDAGVVKADASRQRHHADKPVRINSKSGFQSVVLMSSRRACSSVGHGFHFVRTNHDLVAIRQSSHARIIQHSEGYVSTSQSAALV